MELTTKSKANAVRAMICVALTPALFTASAEGRNAMENQEHIQVYLADSDMVNFVIVAQAKSLAGAMFGEIGIHVDWRLGRPPANRKDAINIEFGINTPEHFKPGALAYALPYEGTHIHVFWDRLQTTPGVGRILGHVMVHEITHILEGVCWHSGEGVMKASWAGDDFRVINAGSLPFAAVDVRLIRAGMEARRQGTTLQAAHPELVPAIEVAAQAAVEGN